MNFDVVPDPDTPGAFRVLLDGAEQSWVDPEHPEILAFEYMQQFAMVLRHTILTRPAEQRLRVIHIGGAGLSLPRWVAHMRPRTAQIVCEPHSELTTVVRSLIPLPARSGIKVRDVAGREGIEAMPEDYADAIIVDAFAGTSVPADLASVQWMQQLARVLRPGGIVLANTSGRAPFTWNKAWGQAAATQFSQVLRGCEAAVAKGRRNGNVLFVATNTHLDHASVQRASNACPFPYSWLSAEATSKWIGSTAAYTDETSVCSPAHIGNQFS